MPLHAGMRVADLGSGAGAYALLLAERLGDEGAVYAVDRAGEAAERLQRERARRNIANLFVLEADLNKEVPLRSDLLDAAVVSNTLHQLQEHERFLGELNRILKSRGRVLVLDWAGSFNNMGPHAEAVVLPNEAVRLFGSAGFSVGDMLPAGSHHYAFIATKE